MTSVSSHSLTSNSDHEHIQLPNGDDLNLLWVDSSQHVPELLWDTFPSNVEGRFWYKALEESNLNDQFTFKYGMVYYKQKPIALIPIFIMNVPIDLVLPDYIARISNFLGKINPAIKYQKTLFVGSPCADECTIGIVGEAENEINMVDILCFVQNNLEVLASTLKIEMIVWKDIPHQYLSSFKIFAQQNNLFGMISYPSTEVKLLGENFSDYLKGMKASRRYNFKKKLRLSHAYGQLEASILQYPASETLDEIFSLFWQTYEKGKTKLERLNRKFFDNIANNSVAWFILLREPATKKLAAFMLCFHLGDKVINKFVGLDYSLNKSWYIYFRLWEAAVNWSYSIGAKSIQSGQTGYRAKIDVGHDLLPLINYCKNTKYLIHLIMSKLSKTINWASLDSDLDAHLKAHPEDYSRGTEI
jgi:hypothetical protein